MFNLKEFQNDSVLEPLVDKLNKILSKNKTQKVIKVIEELEILLNQPENVVATTYILSILVEHDSKLITEGIIQKTETLLNSDNPKLRVNSILIIGFKLLTSPDLVNTYFKVLAKYLIDNSVDVRDNVHFFLHELVKVNPNLVEDIKDSIINSLSIEKNKENQLSLFNLLSFCKELDFNQSFELREISKSLISSYSDDTNSEITPLLFKIITQFFPKMKEIKIEILSIDELLELLDSQFLMKRHNFTQILKKSNITLKDYLKEIEKSDLNDKKILFYTRNKKNSIFVYELEKIKLINFFKEGLKLSTKEFQDTFSQIIQNDSELKLFINTLINLKIINGYYSDLGIFYSYDHFKSEMANNLIQNGIINIRKYNYLPPEFIGNIIKDIKKSQKDKLLSGKEEKSYYSLKKIKEQINVEAAKNSVIDLKSYRERLRDKDFIDLIKNLPKEYLTNYRKGTQWLTNLGTLKISNEIQSSKIFGFFDINKNSKKISISQILLIDVFDHLVDARSGIWDKRREVFYYSKYLTEKIETIRLISDEGEKANQIKLLANELGIDENLILTKIDENLEFIAKEITKKEQINVREYLEKTGMDLDSFMKFIDEIGITFFKKDDLFIFDPAKIEEAKNDIKYMLLDKSKSEDSIILGNLNIKSDLVKELIKDLLKDGKLKGLFHEDEGEIQFFTERGIRNIMLENSFIFSFNDLFYGKDLNQEEIDLMRLVFNDLVKSGKLKGTFDEETLTFSSDEVIFANDYNTVLFEFEKNVNNYIFIFESEFERIKKILTKKEETIFPQEIKLIQEIIDKINEKYVKWRSGLDAFIRRFNKKFLRDQGVSTKGYREMFSTGEKKEVKSFEEDQEVHEHMKNFEAWVKLFNRIEVKFPNIIFYQKRLINNQQDKDTRFKLMELSSELNLI
ncbi:MAG: hypothetical protein KGD58_07475 [Candidatus Lokiarchaeota archaeon]|nr:hypothetical protein [Candidatus Lokiarchaeota archaeon]